MSSELTVFSPLFKLSDVAGLFCEMADFPPREAPRMLQRLRDLRDRGLIRVERVRGAREANRLTHAETHRALLLLVVIELGLQAEAVERLEEGARQSESRDARDVQVELKLDTATADAWPWAAAIRSHPARQGDETPSFSIMLRPESAAADQPLTRIQVPAAILFEALRSATGQQD